MQWDDTEGNFQERTFVYLAGEIFIRKSGTGPEYHLARPTQSESLNAAKPMESYE